MWIEVFMITDAEAVTRICFMKMLFFKTMQNSQEYTCPGVSF